MQTWSSLFFEDFRRSWEESSRQRWGMHERWLEKPEASWKKKKKRWRPAETRILWDTQNWQGEACTSVSELSRLWKKTSNYAKSANIPDIHRFNIWPEQSLQTLWMDGGKWQMLLPAGQTIQVPVPFHAHPSILSVTWHNIKQIPLPLWGVSTPMRSMISFFLFMETAERQARWPHELPGADCTEHLSPST